MGNPLISCIVPVYNAEHYLREAIDSIFAQTYSPIEILVVDDGSTDDSPAILQSYGSRIRGFTQANAGPSVARNKGLAEASGDFIAFLDADDRWEPEKLGKQIQCFIDRPETDLCICKVQNFWMPALQKDADFFRDHPYSRPTVAYTLQALLARKSAFERIGGFDAELRWAQDLDWFQRSRENGLRFQILPETLVFRRIHGANHCMESNKSTIDPGCAAAMLKLTKASLDRRRNTQPVTAPGARPRKGNRE